MDSEVKSHRSLPPLVEGKIQGYLRLTIDKVTLHKRSPGDVVILASWWGEVDSAEFRPDRQTTETYSIKTNINLFKEYIKNCETIELIIHNEETRQFVGRSEINELSNIFEAKPYFKCIPIVNENENRIGEIYTSIKLLTIGKNSTMRIKPHKLQKKSINDEIIVPSSKWSCKESRMHNVSLINKFENHDGDEILTILDKEPKDIYKSILKAKKAKFQEPLQKYNTAITDKLVAQVVARARRLRGAVLKETYDEDPLNLSNASLNDNFQYDNSIDKEAKLYEYFLGREMSASDECKALDALRSASPTPSLIDLASEAITFCCNNNNTQVNENKIDSTMKEMQLKHSSSNKSNETSLLDYIDSIRIYIESFILSPAGYRRVKSSCVSCNDGTLLSVTYFVQYDTTFKFNRKESQKALRDNKRVRWSSKQQTRQVVYFDREGVYNISKYILNTDTQLNFKILIRYLNQKSPTELGSCSMYISEIAKTENLSLSQQLAVINKGIKIGELKVIAELGCDLVHFGKQFVEAVNLGKENIAISDNGSFISSDVDKYKTATGTQSKDSNSVSSISTKKIERIRTDNNTSIISKKDTAEEKKQNCDDKEIDTKNPKSESRNKTLLHGLIYIAEGKDLPELNTFLICRAFWKEDKATSRLCNNTQNPYYHFCQLVPLIHGNELLERIRDNYIVVEVHYKNSIGVNNLLGIAKLPVHQLYIAYRDPVVVPHLLSSKYPIISVDDWVQINNPVTGQSCGELLALVALGTAEQIALLEMSRGLRCQTAVSQTVKEHTYNHNDYRKYVENMDGISMSSNSEAKKELSHYRNANTYNFSATNTSENPANSGNFKNQESQTDISTLKKSPSTSDAVVQQQSLQSEQLVLHTLVDRLTHALNITKTINQAAQTEVETEKQQTNIEEQSCLNLLNCNSVSDDSGSDSLQNDTQLPIETYRSVGVGAEFDEPIKQGPSNVYTTTYHFSPKIVQNFEEEKADLSPSDSSFRALIEIECALHLPRIEKPNESVEPSTYVTFQKTQGDPKNQLHSYMTTNVVPYNCNPKWNWKCDTRLPTELLIHEEKRLILKVWHIVDPETNIQINTEKDIVIGFAAIDLSVLTAGFPTVSGWFHIMDFTGKCNGQIKVSVTPLDNLSIFLKSTTTSTTQIPICNSFRSSDASLYSHDIFLNTFTSNNTQHPLMINGYNRAECESQSIEYGTQMNQPVIDVTQSFEDVSMSFLSTSLKQKLTELDEITKRLQSRLHDVTNTAFEDDLENDFDLHEGNSDGENTDCRNMETIIPISYPNEPWRNALSNYNSSHEYTTKKDHESQTSPCMNTISSLQGNQSSERINNQYQATTMKTPRNEYSLNSNIQYSQPTFINGRYQAQRQQEYGMQYNNSYCSSGDYPSRGTRVHINHLLDKLSFAHPVKKNVMELLVNVQKDNSNRQNNSNINHKSEITSNTVPTQTDTKDQIFKSVANQVLCENPAVTTDVATTSKNVSFNRMSTMIREELLAEDSNDTCKSDELTRFLITSNIRHMDLDNIFNPLLYQHLVPDLQVSPTVSPEIESEAVEQLDNQYTKCFGVALNNEFNETQNVIKTATQSMIENTKKSNESSGTSETFRVTPSGISENIDGNIDITVVHKPINNDLMASNSTDSTTTISLSKPSTRQSEVEIDDNSYCNSSDISVSAAPRQAPDGGNPTEDQNSKVLPKKYQNDLFDSSLSS